MAYIANINDDSKLAKNQEINGKFKIFVYFNDKNLGDEISGKIKENCEYVSKSNYDAIFVQNATCNINGNIFSIFFCNPEHKKREGLEFLHITYSKGSDLIITDDNDFCNYCLNQGIDSKRIINAEIIDSEGFSLEMLLN